MFKALLLSSLFHGFTPTGSHHARYEARLDSIGIEQVFLLRPFYDENVFTVEDDLILAGILDLKRLPETGPIDGCKKINKGLISSGGFMVFTCEKLLPHQPISKHKKAFKRYSSALLKDGWRRLPESTEGDRTFVRSDGLGCEANLNLRLWKDRSMNEPARPATQRNAHRQIVFMAKFYDEACERYYPIAEALASEE